MTPAVERGTLRNRRLRDGDTLVRTRIIGLAVSAAVLAIVLFGVPLAVAVLQYVMQVERTELQQTADSIAMAVAGDVNDEERIARIDAPLGRPGDRLRRGRAICWVALGHLRTDLRSSRPLGAGGNRDGRRQSRRRGSCHA